MSEVNEILIWCDTLYNTLLELSILGTGCTVLLPGHKTWISLSLAEQPYRTHLEVVRVYINITLRLVLDSVFDDNFFFP